MFCSNCGKQISNDVKFCKYCGYSVLEDNAQVKNFDKDVTTDTPDVVSQKINDKERLIGYSKKIDSAIFAGYRKKTKGWANMFTVFVVILAVVGFPIYGIASGELGLADSIKYGLIIGGMFILINFYQNFKKSRDITWDGTVFDKVIKKSKVYNDRNDLGRDHYDYIIKIRRDDGKVIKETAGTSNNRILYDYYNIGDKVRHHKGMDYYEKFDKSKDDKILCVACITMNNIDDDVCFRCKCPLLN